jgi:hypothetical protein
MSQNISNDEIVMMIFVTVGLMMAVLIVMLMLCGIPGM